MMNEEKVHSILARYVRSGDAETLGELFDEVAPALFQTAIHLTSDPQKAEDLLQDTFLALMKASKRWNPKKKATPWISGILKKEALQRGRADRRKPDVDRLLTTQAPPQESAVETSESKARLRQAIDALPALYRDVIQRVFDKGQTPAEIAAQDQETPGSIRTRLHRGVAMLRQNLGPAAILPPVLIGFESTGLAAVKAAVVSENTAAVSATSAASMGIMKIVSMGAAAVFLVTATYSLISHVMDDSNQELPQSAGRQQASLSPNEKTAKSPVRRERVVSTSNRDSATAGRIGNTKSTNADAGLRRGKFKIHYHQGYSFAADQIVDETNSDLWFSKCMGGLVTVQFSAPSRCTSFPVFSRPVAGQKQKLGKEPRFFFDAVLSIDESTITWDDQVSCDQRSAAGDVFVVKTLSGGYALCLLTQRDETGPDWTKFPVEVEYVFNPTEPVFNRSDAHDDLLAGFRLSSAFAELDGTVLQQIKYELRAKERERERRRQRDPKLIEKGRDTLAKEIAELRRSAGSAKKQTPNEAVVLSRTYAMKVSGSSQAAYEASSYNLELGEAGRWDKSRNDWDFNYDIRPSSGLRIRTVTDDRSRAWSLGAMPLQKWGVSDIEQEWTEGRIPVSTGEAFLIHTLDSETDLWYELKIVEVIGEEAIRIRWNPIKSAQLLAAIKERVDTHVIRMSSPIVDVVARSGAGGGNPNRIFLDGSKNAYMDVVTNERIATTGAISMNEKSRGWFDGGLIPEGQKWVITEIQYSARTPGDSNGHGECIISLAGKNVVRIKQKEEPTKGVWTGRVVLTNQTLARSFVEIANSSVADVRFIGHFESQ